MDYDTAEALGYDGTLRDGNPIPRDFKVFWIPQVPGEAFEVGCDTLEDAVALLDVLAMYDLFQLRNRVKPDYSNAGGIARLESDGNWWDVDDDEIKAVLGDALPMEVL